MCGVDDWDTLGDVLNVPAETVFAVRCGGCGYIGMSDECLRGECPACGERVKRDGGSANTADE